ncbi:MAG: DUF3343 domain-containing protein [Candidatus Spyradocola sp.]
MESYGIAAFRSRQAVLRFEDMLRRAGVQAQVVTTPRAVSLGCGLSVRFPVQDMPVAAQAYRANPLHNLIGFYIARNQGGSLQVTPVPL